MSALSIAGFDPSGGAGILADIKTWALLGIKGKGVITALTIQSGKRFISWTSVSEEYFINSLKIIFQDFFIKGVKIGMIGNTKLLSILASILLENRKHISFIVLDPVLKATLGKNLFDKEKDYIEALKQELLPIVDYVTPNLEEFILLFEYNKNLDLQEYGFSAIEKYKLKGIIITGIENKNLGKGDLFLKNNFQSFFLPTKELPFNFHGTGCVFSSAFLGFLLKGFFPEKAFEKSKNWLYLYLKKEAKKHSKTEKKEELCLFL